MHLQPVFHKRSPRNEEPAHPNKEKPPFATTRERLLEATKPPEKPEIIQK